MRTLHVLLTCLLTMAPALAQMSPPLGVAPTYTQRSLTDFPNSQAVTRRIWMPGLDEGYVPQGLTVTGGHLYVAAYRSESPEHGRGPCRLYRISMANGSVTGRLDLPPACGHAGGVAKGPSGKLYVADTRVVFEITLSGDSDVGRISRTIRLSGGVKGSLAAGGNGALWLGSYERGQPGRLFAFPYALLQRDSLTEADATKSIVLPSEAQGAAFDQDGTLWIARSGSKFGELVRLDASTGAVQGRHAMAIGLEDISFDGGTLWTVSEAGSKRWLGWSGFHPLIMRIEVGRLR